MEVNSADEVPEARVTLADVSSFLQRNADDKERSVSLDERTDCAILLLQSLPCARVAVLEKIGEVFFDEAKQYVLELERQHLAGLPLITDYVTSKRETQIKKIKRVLVLSVESNSKAWGPMIFQWCMQTLSQVCGQYATKRNFSSLSIEESFQMWLNCSATNALLEITLCCLRKILEKNQENCLRCVMNATLMYSPHFDWVLAHVTSVFLDIIPFKLLCFSLEAFSNQSRKAEVAIETMLSVFKLIHWQRKDVIHKIIFQLYSESLIVSEDSKIKKNDHIRLCTIPFLLHLCIKANDMFVPVIEQFIDSLTYEILELLEKQGTLREDILQRGLVRRLVECIKNVNSLSLKILQCLIKYACAEDIELFKVKPALGKSVKDICMLMLELLQLQLNNDVLIYSHYVNQRTKKKSTKEPAKSSFLTSLATYTKQICQQMLSTTGKRRQVLLEFLCLMALQEGGERKIQILSFILLNSEKKRSKNLLKICLEKFEVNQPSILRRTWKHVFRNIVESNCSSQQITNVFQYITDLINDERNSSTDVIRVINDVKQYTNVMSQLLLSPDCDDHATKVTLSLLKILCSCDLRISAYAKISQAALHVYFERLERLKIMKNRSEFERICVDLKACDEVLLGVVNDHKGIQQSVVRMLVEGLVQDEHEIFTAAPADPVIKFELMDKNYLMMKGTRFRNNLTSISFKDGLRLTKRNREEVDQQNLQLTRHIFINSLSNLLSIATGYLQAKPTEHDRINNFYTMWGEGKFTRMFPSTYAYTATLLVELVCPEITPVTAWPDEDFLKYTIERDLKVKTRFESVPVLWDILQVISTARPSLYHCSVLVQSLLGMSLKFWQTNRNQKTEKSPNELHDISRMMLILKQAGWLPSDFDSISDIFHSIKPKEVYEILSAIWKYLKLTSFAPEQFLDRDSLGRPLLQLNNENFLNVRAVVKVIFLRNIHQLGHLYHRFLREPPS